MVIPRSVVTIGRSAFRGCKSLKRVLFPNDSALETIEGECLRESRIEEFLAPPSLKRIEVSVFSQCYSLKKVVLNEGLETLSCSFKDSGVEVVELPSTLRRL